MKRLYEKKDGGLPKQEFEKEGVEFSNQEYELAYIEKVLCMVRWKKSHEPISRELRNHIADQKAVFLAQGHDDREAERLAVLEMGDAQGVGIAFDQIYRPKTDWLMLAAALLLLSIGLFAWIYGGNQLDGMDVASLLLGAGLLVGGCLLDYRRLFRHTALFYIQYILFFAVICFFGRRVNGQPRFLFILGIQEYLLLFPLLFGLIIYRFRSWGTAGFLLCGLSAALVLFLGICFGSIGATVIPGIVCLAMATMAIVKGWFGKRKSLYLGIMYTPIALALVGLLQNPYVLDRLTAAFYPERLSQSYGYAGYCIKQALEGASWVGSASSLQENALYTILPETAEYNVLANLVQQFGWIVFAVVAVLAVLLVFRSVQVYQRQQMPEGQILCLAAMGLFCVTFGGGFLSNLGILLIPSAVLPLLAHGNAETIIYMLYIGLLLSVLRYTPFTQAEYEAYSTPGQFGKRISYDDGVLSIRIRE